MNHLYLICNKHQMR